MNRFSTRSRHCAIFLGVVTFGYGSPALAETLRTPEQVYGTRPNNLAALPSGWILNNPVELQVQFNLRFPPNSAEADAFLAEYARFERSLPYNGRITISRVVEPAKYTYVGRLWFPNWHDYRTYEESRAFRDWYVAVWKPAVTEIDELFVVQDTRATGK